MARWTAVWVRRLARMLVFAILVSAFPPAAALADPSDPLTTPNLETPVVPVPVVSFADPTPRPALAVTVTAFPDRVAIGDTTTISVTVTNRSVTAATDLMITLPPIAGAQPVTADAAKGWQWTLPTLDGERSTTVAVTVQAVGPLSTGALVALPAVTATNTAVTAGGVGGALLVARGLGASQTTFTPGQAARLSSQDQRVTLTVPEKLFTQPLTIRQISLADAQAERIAKGQVVPEDRVLGRRTTGAFVLDAQDSQLTDIHRFTTPLTITVQYHPNEVAALGLSEADLTLFWYDEAAKHWQPLSSRVDPVAHQVSAAVDHFTVFTLSDGSSPSSAYVPSLQGFQVSRFTGAASFSVPIEVPAGPAGLKPALSLDYSSGASDGSGGDRPKWQAGWTGKGWSLDVGSVSRVANPAGTAWDYYTFTFGGQSFDAIRGQPLSGYTATDTDSSHWSWHAVDDTFAKVRFNSTLNMWQSWAKDGTRYDFGQALYWRESDGGTRQAYRWLLTRITDTHGNVIRFGYQVDTATLGGISYHPTWYLSTITWGTDGRTLDPSATPSGQARYRVQFGVTNRNSSTPGVDTNWEPQTAPSSQPDAYYAAITPHEVYQLNTINVQSWPSGASDWQLVHRYQLVYETATDSIFTDNYTGTAASGQRVLTLKAIQELGSDGSTALPATTFTYNKTWGDTGNTRPAGYNRLATLLNGQGGKLTFTWQATFVNGSSDPSNAPPSNEWYLYRNNYRVAQTLTEDLTGTGASSLTTYAYLQPAFNDQGHSAAVWYAQYPTSGNGDSRTYMAHPEKREFRGHATVTTRVYDGSTTTAPLIQVSQSWFYQGNNSCQVPLVTLSNGEEAVDETSSCFQTMTRYEGWKGRSYQDEQRNANGGVLSRTNTSYARYDLPYFGSDSSTAGPSNHYRRVGLWRAFNTTSAVEQRSYEGTSSFLTQRTVYHYDVEGIDYNNNSNSGTYGNLSQTLTYNQAGTQTRKQYAYYAIRDDASAYLVDRTWGDYTWDGSWNSLAYTARFYDGGSTQASIGTEGELSRTSVFYDLPSATNPSVTVHSQDTTYGYDVYGNQTSVTTYDGAGTGLLSSSWTFSAAGSGSTARTTTTAYDATFHAFPIQSTNPLGHVEKAEYDYRMGTLLKVVGPNSSGGTTTSCSASGSYTLPISEETTCAQYDVFGRVSKLVKPGDSTSYPTVLAFYRDSEQPFRYEYWMREVAGDSSWGRAHQLLYDGLGRKIQEKHEGPGGLQNIITDFRFDALGRTIAQSQPRYKTESTGFLAYTAPDSGVLYRPTITTYDALGRVWEQVTPDGNTASSSYVVGGLVPGLDGKGYRTDRISDSFGRLTSVRESSSAPTVYEANGGGLSHLIGSASGSSDWISPETSGASPGFLTYGPYAAPVSSGTGQVARFRVAIDAVPLNQGNDPIADLDVYDSVDGVIAKRTIYRKEFVGGISTWQDFALPFDTTGRSGHQLQYRIYWRATARMAHDQTLVSWTQGLSTTSYSYDSLDQLKTVTDALGNVTSMSYDSAGRKTSMSDRDMGSWSYAYHPDGTLARQTDAKGQRLCFYYDALDRLTLKHYRSDDSCPTAPTSAQVATRTNYDETGTDFPFGIGRRTSITTLVSGSAQTYLSYKYDGRGRTTHAVQATTGYTRHFYWTYNSADQVQTITYPDSEVVTYTYDAAWRPSSLCSSLDSGLCYVSSASYTALDQPDARTTGNSVTQDWQYTNAASQLDRLIVGSAFNRTYSYDRNHNLTAIADTLTSSNSQTFGYDTRDRLTSWTLNGTTQSYSYNVIGNLLSKTGVGTYTYPSSGASSVRPHTPSAVNGSAYSYDANGNLTSGGGRSYTWDAENRPTQIVNGSVTESYWYNADGERMGRSVISGGTTLTTRYFAGMWEDIGSTPRKYYPFNGETVAVRNNGTVSYLHGDHLGSVSLTSSSSGSFSTPQEFDPWGAVRSGAITSDTRRNYTGQQLDETGLLFYNARYYDPTLARFISADSVVPGSASGSMAGVALTGLTVDFHEPGFVAAVNGENGQPFWFQMSDDERQQAGSPWGPANPQALNRYSYVQNNPLKWTDPTGHLEYQKASLSDYGYETVTGVPGSSYVDGEGNTLYADKRTGVLYKVNGNGQKERLYKVRTRGVCGGYKNCYKYVYEYDTGFQDFKAHVDYAVGAWEDVVGGAVVGTITGCIGGAIGGAGVGCLVGGAGGGIVGGVGAAGWAIYIESREYSAVIPIFTEDMRDRGAPKPSTTYGPPNK